MEALIERLSKHRTLGGAPKPQIEWLARHGAIRRLAAGEILSRQGTPVTDLYVILDGHLSIYVDQGMGKKKMMEWRGGDVVGLLPYSRLVSPPGDVGAEEDTELLSVAREHFQELIRDCHEITSLLVHSMLDRARHFNSGFLHDEKMVSLGKLAAGLAHELNNPASALTRSAKALAIAVEKTESAARALARSSLSTEQVAAIDQVRQLSVTSRVQAILSPLQQEDREMAIARWLKTHRADPSVAEPLASTDLSIESLDSLAQKLDKDSLDVGLCWVANAYAARRLTQEIQEASSRIYNLVAAVKGFTGMDRAAVPEPVDVGLGLSNTIVVLGSKAKSNAVSVSVNVAPHLPFIHGFAAELNQVWANLVDNALDAAGDGDRDFGQAPAVEVRAAQEGNNVVVRVIDNGRGIPEEIRNRIFDPFFTTKPVGSGTGLGLDIVRRLVQRHNGQIEVSSEPGRTEFRVCLPIRDHAR